MSKSKRRPIKPVRGERKNAPRLPSPIEQLNLQLWQLRKRLNLLGWLILALCAIVAALEAVEVLQ
jgi:hypothetical protein